MTSPIEQFIHQPFHDVVQGLPPHANPAHRHLQFVPTAVSRQEVRPGIARVPTKGSRCVCPTKHGQGAHRNAGKVHRKIGDQFCERSC